MVMVQKWSLMEGEWSCYSSGHKWRENGYLTDVVSLVEGEWLCYRGCHFNGGRKVMLLEVARLKEENGHVTEVVTNRGRMVMLQKWSLMEGEWSCYRGGKFNGGKENGFVTEVACLMAGDSSC